MSTSGGFQGFPRAGLDFLRELAANNNKEWFEAHRQDYIDTVRTPAQQLVEALGERLKALSTGIFYSTNANGTGSLMRINRDTRFSKDKSPYKSNVAMIFWEGPGKKMEMPGFGLQISPFEGTGLVAGIFTFSKPFLKAYRQAVLDDRRGPALVEAAGTVQAAGDYALGGQTYKRVPHGYPADHPRTDWLLNGGLHVYSPEVPESVVTSPEMVDVCFEHFRNMAPIQQWLVGLIERLDREGS